MGLIWYARVQANIWCTTGRARKVVVSLILFTLTAEAVNSVCRYLAKVHVAHKVITVLVKAVVPVAVLVINVVVVHQVRRAAANAAANLGVQPHHHQLTSSSSAVPTAMLVATSLVYVLLYGAAGIAQLLQYYIYDADTFGVAYQCAIVVTAMSTLVFVYNFFVYLITGKRFRSELQILFSVCLSSCSSSAAATRRRTETTV